MADCQAHLSRGMATAPCSSCCKRTRIYEIIIKIPKKNIHFTPSVLTICVPHCPWLLHLLHLEVLVVAGLVVTCVVVVVAPSFGRLGSRWAAGPSFGPIFPRYTNIIIVDPSCLRCCTCCTSRCWWRPVWWWLHESQW